MTTPNPKRLATALQAQLSKETDPERRAAIRRRIAGLAAEAARQDYERKVAPLRRAMAGAY